MVREVKLKSYVRGGFPVDVSVGVSPEGDIDYIDLSTLAGKDASWLKLSVADTERLSVMAAEERAKALAEENAEAMEVCRRRGFSYFGGLV